MSLNVRLESNKEEEVTSSVRVGVSGFSFLRNSAVLALNLGKW